MNHSKITVIGVCGVGCVGKSTYCDGLLQHYKHLNHSRPILLQMGKFFRTTLGPEFFEKLDNPAAPTDTDYWVKSMVTDATSMGVKHSKDVIIDGFPRTKAQLLWLVQSSKASSLSLNINIRFLFEPEGVLDVRRRLRLHNTISHGENEKDLLEVRSVKDAALLGDVISTAKELVDRKKSKLTIKMIGNQE